MTNFEQLSKPLKYLYFHKTPHCDNGVGDGFHLTMEKFGANGLSQVCNYSLDEQRAITFWSLISSYNYKANFLKKKNCGLDLSNICFLFISAVRTV